MMHSGLRLAGSTVPREGRLEVLYNNVWGTVCDDYFDNNYNAARVACFMLGYGFVNQCLQSNSCFVRKLMRCIATQLDELIRLFTQSNP